MDNANGQIQKIIFQTTKLVKLNIISKTEYTYLIIGLLVLRRMECLYIDSVIEESNSHNSALYKNWIQDNFYFNESFLSFDSLSTDLNNIEVNFESYIYGYHLEIRNLIRELSLSTIIEKAKREIWILECILNEVKNLDLSNNTISRELMDRILQFILNRSKGDNFNLISADVSELMAKLTLLDRGERFDNNEIYLVNDDSFGAGDLIIGILNQLNTIGVQDNNIIITGMESSYLNYSIGKLRIILYGYDTSRLTKGDCITDYNNNWKMGHTYSVMKPQEHYSSWIRGLSKEAITDSRFKAGIPKDKNSFYMYLQHVISTLPTKDEISSRACLLSTHYPLLEKKGNRNKSVANIRKWLLDNDYLEGIIKLPEGLFYESSVVYYIWIIDKNKNLEADSKRYIKFLDASRCCERIRPNIFSKTNQLEEEHIEEILKLYTSEEENTSLNKLDINKISIEASWLSNFNSID